jgi:hypothetical protein
MVEHASQRRRNPASSISDALRSVCLCVSCAPFNEHYSDEAEQKSWVPWLHLSFLKKIVSEYITLRRQLVSERRYKNHIWINSSMELCTRETRYAGRRLHVSKLWISTCHGRYLRVMVGSISIRVDIYMSWSISSCHAIDTWRLQLVVRESTSPWINIRRISWSINRSPNVVLRVLRSTCVTLASGP